MLRKMWAYLRGDLCMGGGHIGGEIWYSDISFSYLSFFCILYGPYLKTVVRIFCRTDPTIA